MKRERGSGMDDEVTGFAKSIGAIDLKHSKIQTLPQLFQSLLVFFFDPSVGYGVLLTIDKPSDYTYSTRIEGIKCRRN